MYSPWIPEEPDLLSECWAACVPYDCDFKWLLNSFIGLKDYDVNIARRRKKGLDSVNVIPPFTSTHLDRGVAFRQSRDDMLCSNEVEFPFIIYAKSRSYGITYLN